MGKRQPAAALQRAWSADGQVPSSPGKHDRLSAALSPLPDTLSSALST